MPYNTSWGICGIIGVRRELIIIIYFVALLLFILVYVVVKFLLGKVSSLAEVADVIAIVVGILVALFYIGVPLVK